MKISGLQKLTLLDYPGRVAAIVFLGGCNFRCPFCQNSSLVLTPGQLPEIPAQEFRQFLRKRSGLLDGVCVTGGEPTLHQDLPELFSLIKSEGYLAKLDTNGTNPDMLEDLIRQGLVDYVAMDIKAGRKNYARVCGLSRPAVSIPSCLKRSSDATCSANDGPDGFLPLFKNICRSVDILKTSSLEYEFRTTVVKGLHNEEDFEDIASWLSGCQNYYLQSFRDCEEVLQKDHAFSDFSREEMERFLEIVQKEIPQASLRGV